MAVPKPGPPSSPRGGGVPQTSIPGHPPENQLCRSACRNTHISPTPPPGDVDQKAGLGAAATSSTAKDYAHPHQQNSRCTSFVVLKCPRGLINSPPWREPRWPKIPNLTPARLQHNSGNSCHLPGRTKTARSECEKCLELGGHESKKGVCPAVHLY